MTDAPSRKRVFGLPPAWFAMLGPPIGWSVCFLLLLVLAQWACSTSVADTQLLGTSVVNAVGLFLTLVAMGVVLYAGLIGHRTWRAIQQKEASTEGTRSDQRRHFMAQFGLIISVLFGAGLVFQTITLFLLPPCSF